MDFEKALTTLDEADVQFVIVGGFAITLYGSAYLTYDLDFCYARNKTNLSRLTNALLPFNPQLPGAPPNLPFHFDELTLRNGLHFTLTTDLGNLDLLGEIVGIGDYAAASLVSIPMSLYGRSFAVLTLDALIASKKAAGCAKDLLVLPELEALREATEE